MNTPTEIKTEIKGGRAQAHDAPNDARIKEIRTGNLFKLDVLFDYEWPGNVRELRSVVRRAIALTSSGAIDRQLGELIVEKQKDREAEHDEVAASETQERPPAVEELIQTYESFVVSLLKENLNTAEGRFRQLYEQAAFFKTKREGTSLERYMGRGKQAVSEMKNRQNRSQFIEKDLKEAEQLATRLKEGSDPVSKYICAQQERRVREAAEQRNGSHPPDELIESLIELLNVLREDENLSLVFQRADLSSETISLLDQHGKLTDLLLLNRLLLEDAYPEFIVKNETNREEIRLRFNLSAPPPDTQAP